MTALALSQGRAQWVINAGRNINRDRRSNDRPDGRGGLPSWDGHTRNSHPMSKDRLTSQDEPLGRASWGGHTRNSHPMSKDRLTSQDEPLGRASAEPTQRWPMRFNERLPGREPRSPDVEVYAANAACRSSGHGENPSGAKLARPELFPLIGTAVAATRLLWPRSRPRRRTSFRRAVISPARFCTLKRHGRPFN
jgi:hypothetical protein